VARPRGLEPL